MTVDWLFIDTTPSIQLKRKIQRKIADAAIEAASRKHRVSVEAIKGRGRSRPVYLARRDAMLAMRVDGLSLPEIGRALNRHHTTVMHGLNGGGKNYAALHECVASAPDMVKLEGAQPMEHR